MEENEVLVNGITIDSIVKMPLPRSSIWYGRVLEIDNTRTIGGNVLVQSLTHDDMRQAWYWGNYLDLATEEIIDKDRKRLNKELKDLDTIRRLIQQQ